MTVPKGKARERWTVNQLEAGGILTARYSEHNSAGRDVDVKADVLRIIEVKDRQQLNAHKVVAATMKAHPNYPPSLVWHRVEKPAGAKRSKPSGPTLAMLPLLDYVHLLEIATASERYLFSDDAHDRQLLVEAITAVQNQYPAAYGAFK